MSFAPSLELVCLLTVSFLDVAVLQNISYPNNTNEGNSRSIPFGDEQFIKKYLEFVYGRPKGLFIPVFIVCILIGICGNLCLLYFFGLKSSNLYLTRDGIYFQWMSALDLFICVVVLPYAIFYEIKLVNSEIVCKTMEFTRHLLTTMSHLLLTAYSFEYNKKSKYSRAKKRLNHAVKVILIFSLLSATPVILLFEVHPTYSPTMILNHNASQIEPSMQLASSFNPDVVDRYLSMGYNPTSRYIYFNPTNFCHLTLNIDADASDYNLKNILKTIHIYMCGLMFFVYAVPFIYNFILFMESRPLLGRNSIFVQTIEVNNPGITVILKEIEEKKREQRAMFRRLFYERAALVEAEKRQSALVEAEKRQSALVEAEKRESAKSENRTVVVESDSTEDIDRKVAVEPDAVAQVEVAGQVSEEQLKVEFKSQVALVEFVCCCECCRAKGRTIRNVWTPTVTKPKLSFKRTIMCLSIIDVFFVSMAVVAYLMSDQQSVVLNLLHFKSVFFFWLLSLLKKEVKQATWGCYCSRRDQANPEESVQVTTRASISAGPSQCNTSRRKSKASRSQSTTAQPLGLVQSSRRSTIF